MKFRTLLLASAAVMIAAPAFAQDDITATFYTPAKGKFLSNTSLITSRVKADTGVNEAVAKSLIALEELTYGVTDNFAVWGTIGNNFNVDQDYNNDHNFGYELGAKYTFNYGKILGQVALAYQTRDPRSWYGKNGEGAEYSTNKWEKNIDGKIKLGYALDCGLTPYTTFEVSDEVTHSAKDKDYSWFIGAHKMLDKVSVDAGVHYDFNSDDFEEWFARAEANYFIKDNMTVGVFGDYYLGGTNRKDIDYGYDLGLNFKVAF